MFGPSGNLVVAPSFGGGAVQLVSRTSVRVTVNTPSVGAVNVGGGGGNAPGGGGGTGGTIVIEAPQVVVVGAGAALAAILATSPTRVETRVFRFGFTLPTADPDTKNTWTVVAGHGIIGHTDL